jgi:hypothetical protein
MGLIFGFLGLVLIGCALAICAIGAIWESVRAKKDYKKLEQQWRSRQSQ